MQQHRHLLPKIQNKEIVYVHVSMKSLGSLVSPFYDRSLSINSLSGFLPALFWLLSLGPSRGPINPNTTDRDLGPFPYSISSSRHTAPAATLATALTVAAGVAAAAVCGVQTPQDALRLLMLLPLS